MLDKPNKIKWSSVSKKKKKKKKVITTYNGNKILIISYHVTIQNLKTCRKKL